MDLNNSSMSCSTQFSETEELGAIEALICRLDEARFILPILHTDIVRNRDTAIQSQIVRICKQATAFFLIDLETLHQYLNIFPEVNTPFYHQYVQAGQQKDWYIDYATELPKIKHDIFENEVTWYAENLPKLSQIAQQEKRSPFIKSIADQDPREARHTRMVIDHALEQLEKMAQKIKEAPTLESLQNLQKDVERYGWCLTGIAPLLPVEEQNPFQQTALYQRKQKARLKIQEAESVWHQNH